MAQNPLTPAPSIGRGRLASGTSNGITTNTAVSGIDIKPIGGSDVVQQALITLTNMPITITDALAYASVLLGTMPEGKIRILDSTASLAFTTTSAIAGTLNSGVTVQWSVGHAAASATTLATTMLSYLPGTGGTVPTFASSTTINVASATVTGGYTITTYQSIDGTATPAPIYLNLALATGTDIDADATLTVSGTILITYFNAGDPS